VTVRIEQKPTFRRAYKKLHPNPRTDVDQAIRTIISQPETGEEKRGDLHRVSIHKFDCVNQQYLLAYEWKAEWRLLLALGPHENFYRKLKR